MALAGNVSLYASQGRFGVTVEGGVEELPPAAEGEPQLKPAAAKGPVARLGGELFVGAQAGIGGTVEVNPRTTNRLKNRVLSFINMMQKLPTTC